MEQRPERRSQVTTQNYTLYIDEFDGRKVAHFVDPQRNYVRVARVNVPVAARTDARQLDMFYRKIQRRILDYYRQQRVTRALGLTFYPEAELSPLELELFLKRVSSRREEALVELTVPPPKGRSKRRLAED